MTTLMYVVCTTSYHSVATPAPPTRKYSSEHVKRHHANACRPNRCPAPLSRNRHLHRELRRHGIRRARPPARAHVGVHQRRRQESGATKGKLPRHAPWQLEAGIRSARRQVIALFRPVVSNSRDSRPSGALTSMQQWPATGAQYVPTSQYPLSVVQHDCTWSARLSVSHSLETRTWPSSGL